VIESSQAYERVKERDRLAALGEMAAGLAHEIRNPLGAIKGAAQLLITDGTSSEAVTTTNEMVELLDIIVEEANRLNNVVTRFLDYARSERPGREGAGKVDLNQVVRKTVQLLQQELPRSVELRVRIDEMLPSIAGDPESLVQVFLNLGQNALHAMADGGTLEILTTRRRRSRLGYGQFAEVRFRDTGVGIPRDKLKKLFIPFYTTKQKGTGLGLAISHRIVNQHGGTIEVRSTLGQGSTFSVFLPAAEPVVGSEVTDITETGGLRPIRNTGAGEAVAPPAGAVATVGKNVESISPGDSAAGVLGADDSGLGLLPEPPDATDAPSAAASPSGASAPDAAAAAPHVGADAASESPDAAPAARVI
jgi:nitrogen-specific signal transduction histidine kinase